MFIGTFDSDDTNQFLSDVSAAFDEFKASGVKNILIDVTDNGGP
jgi:C-terminal processing protease CtpA/Prc